MEKASSSEINRREFLGAAAAALFAGVTITLLGCGDDKSTGDTAGTGDIEGDISGNHGHKAVVTKAQIDAGGALDLHIQNTASHDHTVSLSADDMAKLKAGQMVTVETSSGGQPSHTHSVMFM
jgi:hypothetical protein